ncbi:MAG: acyltransferase family protein [Lachnospiraceae bacterium]|nr:acyltransferase family protein [Candidatus Colinaster equi]
MKKKRNLEFTILGAIGMLLVIMGHLDYGILTIGGLFPYYSFHVLIFPFISGYFYKPEYEKDIRGFIKHKATTLLFPYFIWNIIYGTITLLLHCVGISIGADMTPWNLFVEPFIGGHQFMYNAPAWFVPALFLLETCNVIGRKLLNLIKIKNEWILAAFYLLIGCFAVYMAMRGSVYGYYKIPGRIMVMAPALALGRLYKCKLEKWDTVPSIILIPLLCIMNAILGHTHGGLAYSVVWVTGFANTPLTPFITMLTGIWFWLRISKLLARFVTKNRAIYRFVNYFGSNTFSVMMHQLIAFMLVKGVFCLLYLSGVACSDFDMELFGLDVYYTYVPGGHNAYKLIYLAVGIVIPLCIARLNEVFLDTSKSYPRRTYMDTVIIQSKDEERNSHI